MTIQHVNPNCPGAEFCKPHGEDGGVSVDRKKLDAHVTAQIIAELERLKKKQEPVTYKNNHGHGHAVPVSRFIDRINYYKAKETQL